MTVDVTSYIFISRTLLVVAVISKNCFVMISVVEHEHRTPAEMLSQLGKTSA